MEKGKALELFIKQLLINVGFAEVKSDGLFIFDGSPGQMIQGLGGAHNADVLLEPPVQTPFYYPSRLIIECKNYSFPASLNIVRSVLGLREDINHFEVIDQGELNLRRSHYHNVVLPIVDRYTYQVALASTGGYSKPAQMYASVHRIPLLDFRSIPDWTNILTYLQKSYIIDSEVIRLANEIGQHMAVGVLKTGQLLFLYQKNGYSISFDNHYSLFWQSEYEPWKLVSGGNTYVFHLPEKIMSLWITNSSSDIELRKNAIGFKESALSNMVVYYRENALPTIKMISIDKQNLEEARRSIELYD